jgi:hypothetical protein
MTSLSKNQAGSSHLIAILGVLIIAVVAFAGYRVLNSSNPDASSDNGTVVSTQSKVPNTINNKTDLNKASNALDQTSIDGDVNPNSLNNDLNAL